MLTEKTSRRIKCEGRVAGQSLYTDHRVPIRSKLLHANRMRTESLATAPLRRRETVFGRQRQKAPNCLRAVLPPSRDWKPTYSPPQNRGYSANARPDHYARAVRMRSLSSHWQRPRRPPRGREAEMDRPHIRASPKTY